jgi:hypothetical protein
MRKRDAVPAAAQKPLAQCSMLQFKRSKLQNKPTASWTAKAAWCGQMLTLERFAPHGPF